MEPKCLRSFGRLDLFFLTQLLQNISILNTALHDTITRKNNYNNSVEKCAYHVLDPSSLTV